MPNTGSGGEWIAKLCKLDKALCLMECATHTVTFAAATTGDQGSHELFTVTGTVVLTVFGVCTTSLTGASSTIALGTAASTAEIAAAFTCTNIDANMIWVNGDCDTEVLESALKWIMVDDVDVGYTIATADCTGGVIKFYCYWYPISDDGNVVTAPVDTDL
jgi:hypothetical protein